MKAEESRLQPSALLVAPQVCEPFGDALHIFIFEEK